MAKRRRGRKAGGGQGITNSLKQTKFLRTNRFD